MKKNLVHTLNLIFLFLALILVSAVFFYFQGNKDVQKIIASILGIIYFVWGIVHHSIMKDLYPKVVIEYLLVSLIGVLLMFLVLA